jgi:hypothetical protein
MDAALLDRVRERAHHVLLPDDVGERARAVAAVERSCSGHWSLQSSAVTTVFPVTQVAAKPRLAPSLAVRAAALIPLGALLAFALVRAGFLNYDTAYALLWGGDLAHGRLPDYDVPLAPTAHPLATLLGVVLTPLGDGGQLVWVAIAFLALGAVGWLAYELAARSSPRRAGRSRAPRWPCSRSPGCSDPRPGCSRSPTSPTGASPACSSSRSPRPSSGASTTSRSPATRCTR